MASISWPRVDGPGGVRRGDEQQGLGPRGDHGLQLLDAGAEAAALVGGHDDGHAAGQGDRLGIGRPERGEDDDLVAGVAQHGEGVGDGLFAPVGHQHLLCRHRVARVPQGLGHDGLPQGRDTGRRGVAVVGGVTAGFDCRLDDVRRSREIRLARPEPDDVLAGSLQGLGLGIDRQRGRGRHGGRPSRYPSKLGWRVGSSCHGCNDSIRARHPRHHHSRPTQALRRPLRMRPVQGPPRAGGCIGRSHDHLPRDQSPPKDREVAGRTGARRLPFAVLPPRRL